MFRCSLSEYVQPQLSRNKYFDNFNSFNTTSSTNPVDEWLNTPPITTATDGLQYWTAMLTSGHPLARMSLDFLSISGQCLHISTSLLPNYSFSYVSWCWMGILPWRFDCVNNVTLIVRWEYMCGIRTWVLVWFTGCCAIWWNYGGV